GAGGGGELTVGNRRLAHGDGPVPGALGEAGRGGQGLKDEPAGSYLWEEGWPPGNCPLGMAGPCSRLPQSVARLADWANRSLPARFAGPRRGEQQEGEASPPS